MASNQTTASTKDLINVSLTPSQIVDAIVMAYNANQPVFLWGPPGTAKSQLFRQAQQRLQTQFRSEAFGLVDCRMVTKDTTDLNGIPSKDGDYTKWLRPRFLPETGKGIFLMDEFNSAPPMMQAAGYSLVLDRMSGEHKLAEGWVPMAAGNYDTDGGVTTRQPTPLKSRFMHLNIQTVKDSTREGTYHLVNQSEWCDQWVTWAVENEIHPHVIAYHRKTKGVNLYAFDKNEQTYPCLRSWEFVSNLMKQGLGGNLLYPGIAGLIGQGYASEVVAYMTDALALPDIDLILNKPEKAPIPKNVGMKYAVVTMLGCAVSDAPKFVAALKYLNRPEMGAEFLVIALRDMVMRVRTLAQTPEFIDLCKGPIGDALLDIQNLKG